MYPYSVFVNTTDKFEDCWLPFFRLFTIYWPDFKGTIYLNTEYKEFQYEGLNIVSVRNCERFARKQNTWSECLEAGVKFVDNEILLYMQEDYFFHGLVENDTIHKFALIMENSDMDCIHLTDQHSFGPFQPSPFEKLWRLSKYAHHKISCQAALWKKETLIQFIRSYENPWQFELYGTLRSQLSDPNFYTIDRNMYGIKKKEVIPYIFTGVIQGKWYEKVVDLFSKHDIEVDYGIRGFITERGKYALIPRIRRKFKDINRTSILEILKLKYFSRPGMTR
ncbi:MAG: hypothetical protein M3N30_08425 [Bacteroidota bacterium]|nr:hypothetical protein [Bacteroidota bacterium]